MLRELNLGEFALLFGSILVVIVVVIGLTAFVSDSVEPLLAVTVPAVSLGVGYVWRRYFFAFRGPAYFQLVQAGTQDGLILGGWIAALITLYTLLM